jgi:dTDP-4-dehydrorhamnose 3,5-epimerase
MPSSIRQYSKHIEERGSIYTTYNEFDFPTINFVQDKVSVSKKGVIRGFHGDDKTYKLITCLHGAFDLVVFDMDKQITQKYHLNSEDSFCKAVLVPPRHLNGHQCLSEECVLHYKWSEYYNLGGQYSVYYNDDTVNPQWRPSDKILVSARDMSAPSFLDL